MKALIFPNRDGDLLDYVVDVCPAEFGVASPLFWAPCSPSVRAGDTFTNDKFTTTAPKLSLDDFQKAHDAYINAPALARGYDSFATFALRATRPGPWQAESIAFFDWMEACNLAGYTILADIQAGNRSIPATTAVYIALLPALPPSLL